MLAFQSVPHSTGALEVEPSVEHRLSPRAAMMCIVTLSMLGWTAVLVPLWALAQ